MGGGGTPGTDGGGKYARRPRAVRSGAVLLDDSIRFPPQLRWSRRDLGRAGFGRQYRGARLQAHIPARREDTRRGHYRTRPREPGKRTRHGESCPSWLSLTTDWKHIAASRKEANHVTISRISN